MMNTTLTLSRIRLLLHKLYTRWLSGKYRIGVICLSLSVILTITLFPHRYLPSVDRGIALFVTAILPTMLPFFFFTALLNGVGFLQKVSLGYTSRLYHTAPITASVQLLGFLSGYPVGMVLLRTLYSNGKISATDAKRAVSFCSTTSPLFIMGTIGNVFLSDIRAATAILIAHYSGAILNGLIYRQSLSDVDIHIPPVVTEHRTNPIAQAMNVAITSLLSVCGYVAIFSLLIDICTDIHIFQCASVALAPVLSVVGLDASSMTALMQGAVEMTRGIGELSALTMSRSTRIILISFALSLGGSCVAMQSLTYCRDFGANAAYYMCTKTTMAIISAAVAALLMLTKFF